MMAGFDEHISTETGMPMDVVHLLALLAEQGQGLVLGVAQPGRAGVKRISAPSPDFERLLIEAFDRRRPSLVRFAMRRLADHGRAEDVVQQAFENVWKGHRDNPKDILNLDAYVQTAVTHAINRELRNVIRLRDHDDLDAEDPHLPPSPDNPENHAVNAITLTAALKRLSTREREVVVLRYQCDLTEAETAGIIGVSVGSVKSYASHGLAKLRERLAA